MQKPQFIDEQTVKVERRHLSSVPHRLSFDNGATLSKILYVTDCREDADSCELHLVTVPKAAFADTIKWIKESGDCRCGDVAKMTGVNSAVQELLQQQFGASCEHVIELLTQVRGCHWMVSSLPPEQLFLPPEQPEPRFRVNQDNELLAKISDNFKVKEQESLLPAVLVHLGSGSMISVLSSSGRMDSFHFSMFGGKSLLGLALLTVGTNSYDELFALAERGERANVDAVVKELVADDPASPYGRFDGDLPMMHFGKAAEGRIAAADAKKEDVARSLVSLFCWNLFGHVSSICTSTGVPRVLFGGNFFRHRLARVEFESVKALLASSIQHHFLRQGGHMGAIGALVASNADAPAYLKF